MATQASRLVADKFLIPIDADVPSPVRQAVALYGRHYAIHHDLDVLTSAGAGSGQAADKASWGAQIELAAFALSQPPADLLDVLLLIGMAAAWVGCVRDNLPEDSPFNSLAQGIETATGRAAILLNEALHVVGMDQVVADTLADLLHDAGCVGEEVIARGGDEARRLTAPPPETSRDPHGGWLAEREAILARANGESCPEDEHARLSGRSVELDNLIFGTPAITAAGCTAKLMLMALMETQGEHANEEVAAAVVGEARTLLTEMSPC